MRTRVRVLIHECLRESLHESGLRVDDSEGITTRESVGFFTAIHTTHGDSRAFSSSHGWIEFYQRLASCVDLSESGEGRSKAGFWRG